MSPAWGDQPDVVEAAVQKLRADVARERLHTRGTGSFLLDQERAKVELTEEERARRSSRPKSRRWRGLGKFDDKIDELNRKLEDARQERQRAEERVQGAPEADARSLAAWIAGGERGKRPEATLYERQRERDAAQLTLDALQRTLDEALEERLRYVERHRDKMLADAQKDVEARRARLLAHVQELPALRQELLDARDLLTWTATYPDQAEQYGFPTALALGLREPVERTLETKARSTSAASSPRSKPTPRRSPRGITSRCSGVSGPHRRPLRSTKRCGPRMRSTRSGSARSASAL